MWLYLPAVLTYLAVLAAVGVWQSRRPAGATSGDDFVAAGRTPAGGHVLVFTLLSTWIGSGSLLGGAGLGYRDPRHSVEHP